MTNTRVGSDSEIELEIADRRAADRETFLGCPRAFAVCNREFEVLVGEVLLRIASLEGDVPGIKADVRRTPSRCIIQFGPLALTVSWVRAQPDRVLDGRLLVIAWEGVVAPATDRLPERARSGQINKPATILREEILKADATSGDDWSWQSEDAAEATCLSRDLALRVVNSLASTLQKRRTDLQPSPVRAA